MSRRPVEPRFDLKTLGWDPGWEEEFRAISGDGPSPGRVVVEHKSMYRVATETGQHSAEVAGRFRFQAARRSDFPGVGDWVALKGADDDELAIIHAVLPRRTAFIRKAAGVATEEQVVAANVDTVLIVSALDHEFNPRRLERYLALVWQGGAQPVVVMNKADVSDDVDAQLGTVHGVAFGVPVHPVSARTGEGLDELGPYFREGHTVGFVGSSGVGKSTLINRLLVRDVQATGEVREHDSRGRHTTTHRELFVLPQGGIVIDTPGMRELQLWDADEGVGTTFGDIDALAEQCRFSDCRHENEPECAVRAAVDRGELDPERVASHHKLVAELRYSESRLDKDAMLERKRHEKVANKAMKEFKSR